MFDNDENQTHEETVSFDQQGNIVVNKDSHASKKLVARRAIEAIQERRSIERAMKDFDYDFE